MREFARRVAMVFFAGAIGGLVSGLTMWLLGAAGVTAQFGVALAPPLTLQWLETRLVIGGLWGLLLTPFFYDPPGRVVGLGAMVSLAPAAQVLYISWRHPTEYGTLAPLFVLAFSLLWGVVTGGMAVALRDRS